MSQFTLRQLEYFIACAELGSMRAASEKVHLTQSAISTAIAELESTLGTQLLIRHARGLAMTPAGKKVLADARTLIGLSEDLHTSVREIGSTLAGSLRIGCYTTLAPILLPKVIDDFTSRYPDVELDIVEGSHKQLGEELQSGNCEIVLSYGSREPSHADYGGVTEHVIRSAPPHLVLPSDHRLASAERVHLRDIADEKFILFNLHPGGEYFLNIFDECGVEPNISFRTQSFETARSLVARGLGYTLLTQETLVKTSYEGFEVVTQPLQDELAPLNIVALQLATDRPTRRATAFLQQCFESLGE